LKTLYTYILLFIIYGISFAQVSSSKDTVFHTEEINVISNRIEMNIFQSPTSIKLIESKQINSSNGERISDVLKSSGNIFMKSYGSNASLNTISFNGLGAEHTLILIDGRNINSFQNSQVDLSTIPKDKIEKIEIINNGASSIYGSNAIGGVLNIITKNGINDKPSIKISGAYGSYDLTKVSANLVSSTGNLNYDLFYSNEKSKDNFDYLFNNGIRKIERRRENNNFSTNNFYVNLNYGINEKNELRYNTSYISQKRNIPGIETGNTPSNAEQIDDNWNNYLSYKLILDKDLYISSGLNYQNNLMKYKDIFSKYFYKNRVISNNTILNYNYKYIKSTFGYEVLYADLNSESYEKTVSRKQYSIFSAMEYDIKKKLKLFPSIRYDFINDINKSIVTAKFGINYKPFEKIDLNLRSSIGNNFGAPTFNELYYINSGNPNLKPEKSINIDAGLIYRLNFISENTIEFNYTRINLEDKIVWKPGDNGYWRPFNIDKSESNIYSFDVKMKKNIRKDIQIVLNYNYTYNKSTKVSSDYSGDPSYGKQIFYVPLELSKINFESSYKDAGVNLFYSFTGKRYSDFENINRLPVIDLLDGNVFYKFKISKILLETKFEVNNILNEDYQVIPGYPMPLRNYKFILNLTY
jgi:outer membrane cobalamin receptor